MSRLKDLYKSEIVDAMVKKFGYKNIMEVPKLDKIVINMGVGEAKDNSKVLETAVKELETITGQKVVTTKAKNSVANFKIREGMPIGCKVTLRGERCTSSLIVSLILLYLVYVTSEALIQHHLMEEEITLLVLRNRSSSLKSNMIKSIKSEVWM